MAAMASPRWPGATSSTTSAVTVLAATVSQQTASTRPAPRHARDGGQGEPQHRAVEADEEGGQPGQPQRPQPMPAEELERSPQVRAPSLRSSHGPGPRKPHVAPAWRRLTPSSEDGPGSSQKASATGTPTRVVASTSTQAQPPRRW